MANPCLRRDTAWIEAQGRRAAAGAAQSGLGSLDWGLQAAAYLPAKHEALVGRALRQHLADQTEQLHEELLRGPIPRTACRSDCERICRQVAGGGTVASCARGGARAGARSAAGGGRAGGGEAGKQREEELNSTETLCALCARGGRAIGQPVGSRACSRPARGMEVGSFEFGAPLME